MLFKNVRYLIISCLLFALVACGNGSEEQVSEPAPEVSANNIIENETRPVRKTTELKDAEEIAEERKEIPETEDTEARAVTEKESIYSVQDRALNQLIAVSHLEKEGYSYHFAETASPEFIQIEVREVPEKSFEHTSLEGVYRYLLGTEEILMKDYFSGDFIPYEQNE